jgi:hypothetical protein
MNVTTRVRSHSSACTVRSVGKLRVGTGFEPWLADPASQRLNAQLQLPHARQVLIQLSAVDNAKPPLEQGRLLSHEVEHAGAEEGLAHLLLGRQALVVRAEQALEQQDRVGEAR